MEEAMQAILNIVDPPKAEIGKVYTGRVVNITKFGAFVNILPGRDGLLHISKIGGGKRIDKVEDVLSLGDSVKVVVREIDDRGKVSLDMEGAPSGTDDESVPETPRAARDDSENRGNGDGGDRNRSRDRGGERSRDRGGDRNRDRDDRNRDRRTEPVAADKPGRKVVSFEDDFESGL